MEFWLWLLALPVEYGLYRWLHNRLKPESDAAHALVIFGGIVVIVTLFGAIIHIGK